MTHFDRHDIVEAHYWHAADYHGGMSDPLYAKLSRISRYFTPAPQDAGPTTDNAREIYASLTTRTTSHDHEGPR